MKKIGLLGVLVAFIAVLSVPHLAGAQTVTLRYANFFPAPHANSQLIDQWGKEVEKRTKGKVKVNMFPGATLCPAPQTYDSVVKGIADIGTADVAYTRGKFPLTEVFSHPIGYKSALIATRMENEYFKKFKPKEFDDVKVLYLYAHGPGIFHSKKPINKLEDLKGTKIRSHGVSAKAVQALGAAPVGMPMTESYDALSKGVADGIVCPYEAMKGWKLAEVTNYHTENYANSYVSCFFVVMNKAKWNSLPPDVQKAIEQINQEWIEKAGKVWDDIDTEGKQVATKRGNKVIHLTKEEEARWVAKTKPLLDDYVKVTKEKGLPGDQVLKFCQDYLKANQK